MGSGDLCFLVDDLEGAEAHLAACGVAILVERRRGWARAGR